MIDPSNLKTTFDTDADQYHRFRPHYPPQLFSRPIRDTGITSQSRLLEIGPGTGQATEPLAQLGCDIVGIELGEHLAQKARHILQAYPKVKIVTGSFEDTEFTASSFDLIYSATAFHWIAPAYKFAKTSKLLKSGGYLAIIHTEHVSDEKGDGFFSTSHPIYQKYGHNGSSYGKVLNLPKISGLAAPTFDSTLFDLVSFNTFPIAISYSAEEYVGLLSTYSPTIAMPTNKREHFLSDIKRLIDTEFGGSAIRNFAFTLTIFKNKMRN